MLVFGGCGLVVATVALLNTQTGLSPAIQTFNEGLYEFPLIWPGRFNLAVTATGFHAAVKKALKLDVNRIANQNISLQPGAHNWDR